MTDRPKFGKRPAAAGAAALSSLQTMRLRAVGQRARAGARADRWCECSVTSQNPVPGEPKMVREGVVLDASRTGARIRFRSKGGLPERVTVKASRLGLNRTGRVIWQREFDAGIAFDG